MQSSQLSTVDHSRAYGRFTYIYPVISRRSHGLSIGVNLSLDNRCNYNCVYCEVDRNTSVQRAEVDPDAFGRELFQILSDIKSDPHGPEVKDVTFAGNGEPMAVRCLDRCIELAARILSALGFADTPVVVITNGTYVHRSWGRRALTRLAAAGGQAWVKLDAGDQHRMTRTNGTEFPIERLEENILDASRILPVTIQSMFMKCWGKPPSPKDVDQYICCLKRLAASGAVIRNVQAYTVARQPRSSHITPLDGTALELIASRIQGEAGLPVETFA
ncbi:radical SAM protein [Desulfoluna limicola]|nr:radical SAM protein [Desulfoluna limicola]